MPRGRPSPYKTVEERKAARVLYMRDYQRRTKPPVRTNHFLDKETRVDRSQAEYDPLRDGPREQGDLTAQICGDPPKGRSALDEQAKIVTLPVVRVERQ